MSWLRGALARDAVVAALVAILVFQALRRWVADHYLVPTRSMQPTLHGDERDGDIVLVDKTASARDLRPYDLAVFASPEDPARQLVKRVVALGEDPQLPTSASKFLDIRDGDLWVGTDGTRLVLEAKDPFTSRDMRIPWFVWPAVGDEASELCVSVPPGRATGAPITLPSLASVEDVRAACADVVQQERARNGSGMGPGWLSTVRPVDVSYVDGCGRRGREGGNVAVTDVGADFTIAATAVAHVFCAVDLRPDAWLLHWDPAAGSIELWCNGSTVDRGAMRTGCAPGTRIEFGFLDGRFFFAVDGDAAGAYCVARRAEWTRPDRPVAQPGPRNQLHIGAIAGSPVALPRGSIFHDVHWLRDRVAVREKSVYEVPPGTAFLLGDNAGDSRDSRHFKAVSLASFRGRPLAIMAPAARRHWLPR